MYRQSFDRHAALLAAVGLVSLGSAQFARAVNLLLNPGFESPSDTSANTDNTATGWTFYGGAGRGNFGSPNYSNHTPGGTWGAWLEAYEPVGGVYQTVTNLTGGTPYTLSAYFYFEAGYAATGADSDLELSWQDSSGSSAGYSLLTIQPSQVTAGEVDNWTQFTLSAAAPATATQVKVSFDVYGGFDNGGAQSLFVDDADLEGAGIAPTTSVWALSGSGDWNVSGNWSSGSVPNSVGVEADFFAPPPVGITGNHTVYTDVPVTVGTINFMNPFTYVIAGAGNLTLQASTGNAQVIVQQGTQEINLPTTIASNTVFNVAANSTLVIADPISINSGLSLTQTGTGMVTYESTIKVGSSASIAFGSSSFANSLVLFSSSKASLSGSTTVLELQDGLSLASGATLDVGAGQVNVDYIGASPASTIAASLKSAYANGAWTGSGITSSQVSHVAGTSVGYDDTGTQVQIKYTWIGDLNLSGTVDGSDLSALDYGAAHHLTGWQNGDLNYDGVINSDDYSLFQYGQTLSAGRSISAVPEPGVAALLAAGLFVRRRRSAKA